MNLLKLFIILSNLIIAQPYEFETISSRYKDISNTQAQAILNIIQYENYNFNALPDYLQSALELSEKYTKIDSVYKDYLVIKYIKYNHLIQVVNKLKSNAKNSSKNVMDFLFENADKHKIVSNFVFGLTNKDPQIRLFCASALKNVDLNPVILDFVNHMLHYETTGISHKFEYFENVLNKYFSFIFDTPAYSTVDERKKYYYINFEGDYQYGNAYEEIQFVQKKIIRHLLIYRIEQLKDITANDMKNISEYIFNVFYYKLYSEENKRNVPANLYRIGASSYKFLRYNNPTVKLNDHQVRMLAELLVGALQNKSYYVQERSAELLYSLYFNDKIINNQIKNFIKKSAKRIYTGNQDVREEYPSVYANTLRTTRHEKKDSLRDKILLLLITEN